MSVRARVCVYTFRIVLKRRKKEGEQVFGKGRKYVELKIKIVGDLCCSTRLKCTGNCTGRFYKLGRSYSSPPAEENGKLNGLTSTIFLRYKIFLENATRARPFSLFLSLSLLSRYYASPNESHFCSCMIRREDKNGLKKILENSSQDFFSFFPRIIGGKIGIPNIPRQLGCLMYNS